MNDLMSQHQRSWLGLGLRPRRVVHSAAGTPHDEPLLRLAPRLLVVLLVTGQILKDWRPRYV